MTTPNEDQGPARGQQHAEDVHRSAIAALSDDVDRGQRRLEFAILAMLSVFHRPADPAALDALRREPALPGLTDIIPEHLTAPAPGLFARLLPWFAGSSDNAPQKLAPEEAANAFTAAVEALRKEGLIQPVDETGPDNLQVPDAVRTYFASRLKADHPEGWRQAHARLYGYYQSLPISPQPKTLAEMEPLYAAIVHGCASGRHQDAFDRIYSDRMLQRQSLYLGKNLGAYDAWLEVLSNFFEECWTRPVQSMNLETQRAALAQAGFALRGCGRFVEAMEPIKAALQSSIDIENWVAASAEAQNLSEILSTLGDLQQALIIARDSVQFADKTKDSLRRLSARARLGDALHQYGETRLAARNFRRAERWQFESRKDLPILISLRHYHYSDLLLELGRHDEVRVRGLFALDVSREFQGRGMGPLDIALDKLTIARAAHAQWQEAQGLDTAPFAPPSQDEDGDPDAEQAREPIKVDRNAPIEPSVPAIRAEAMEANRNSTDHHDVATRAYNQSVDELRAERQIAYLPAALIARAGFQRDQRNFDAAEQDLAEAHEVAAKDGMRLYLTDIALERIRLALSRHAKLDDEKTIEDVEANWREAHDLINACCYHRRDRELAELRQQIDAAKS